MKYQDFVNLIIAQIKAGFFDSIQGIVDAVTLKELTDAVEARDFDKVVRLLGIVPGAFRPFTRALEQIFENGAAFIASSYPKKLFTPDGTGIFRFNVKNDRAETYLRNQSSTLIGELTDDVRQTVRTTLDAGMVAGSNPRTVALNIVGRYDTTTKKRVGGIVGLNSQQENWVRSTRTNLEQLSPDYFTKELRDKRFDRTVQKAIDTNTPLPDDVIVKLTTRYSDNALKYRGETIARLEAMESLSAAEYESTKQIVEMGAAREKDVVREWDDAGDRRVRHTHQEMNGQKVGLNEPFVSPSGARMMYPRDRSLGAPADERIGCRCRAKTTIDWAGAALDD